MTSRERQCGECGRQVTKTNSLGEVGHDPDCPLRDEAYHGRVGDGEFGNPIREGKS